MTEGISGYGPPKALRSRRAASSPRLWMLLTLLLSPSACSSSPAARDSNAPPPGCQETLCDFTVGVCLQHCLSACNSCAEGAAGTTGSDVGLALLVCEDNGCGAESPVCPEPCAEPDALDNCRQTPTNSICMDHVGDPVPAGSPPCNASMSAAGCAIGSSAWYTDALYALAPACQQCDEGWAATCGNTVCQAEQQAAQACVDSANQYPYQHFCDDASACSECGQEYDAVQTCLDAAFVDPSDPGGCNSGSHACWVQPVCPPIY